jgi:hypothetical protein
MRATPLEDPAAFCAGRWAFFSNLILVTKKASEVKAKRPVVFLLENP